MNKKIKQCNWRVVGQVVAGFFLSASLTTAEGSGSAEDVLERMAEAYASVKSLRAELQQVKSYPQLGLTDPPEKGVLYVKRKSKDKLLVRLEIQQPEQRIVTVTDDGRYMLYQPRIKQAIEGHVGKKAGGRSGTSFMSYFMGDLSGAKKEYDIVSLGEERVGQNQTIHIRLTAKPEGRGYYPQIDLWIDKKLWIPVQQELLEPNRSLIQLQFDAIRINEEMKDSLFTLKLPPGVERVKG